MLALVGQNLGVNLEPTSELIVQADRLALVEVHGADGRGRLIAGKAEVFLIFVAVGPEQRSCQMGVCLIL